jgi:hypothetical protein
MNKERLEWVMSGLKQYALTTGEDLFLKTVSAEFDKNRALTAHQEESLENLYKEKSKLRRCEKIGMSPPHPTLSRQGRG